MEEVLNDLEQYAVSWRSGFVPSSPSEPLPTIYKPWEDLATALPSTLKDGEIVAKVNSLSTLKQDALTNDSHLQRAYVLLSFIINAYIHGGHQNTIPPALSDPYLVICERLGLEPVISFASLCLFNYRQSEHQVNGQRKDQTICNGAKLKIVMSGGEALPTSSITNHEPNVLSGLRSIVTFTGTIDEETFYLVPVLVERLGGPLIPLLLRTLIAARNGQWSTVVSSLDTCADTLCQMANALGEMSLCNPDFFYNTIRPFIGGIDGTFVRGTGEEISVKLAGGSAVQSSLFPFLDHIFGIKHESPLLKEMRAYMPGKHRRLLEDVENLPSLVDLAERGEAGNEVRLTIGVCKKELIEWRTRHLALVARYVVVPAAKERERQRRNGNVVVSAEVSGTAGSNPLVFLRKVRDDVKVVSA
ncbi:hypothetical protein H2198_000316 [Neophaeococcomyces mojaviensis]|uniref:Uncharacterized protein n=1 Tax=Neophaeococcomyces mojaviensis TaxID=3383035 RepID=A0ACC3AKB0_9EURO|nr:hypothetical protein H2198_000316 [Knufia sp. JES_112]